MLKNICLAIGLFALMGCDRFMKYKEDILTLQPKIYMLATMQTAPANRKDSVVYKNGFEVTASQTLSAAQFDSLTALLIQKENYLQTDTKRCPFVPHYLLEKDTSFTLMISLSPCNKALFVKNGTEKVVDFASDAAEKMIAGMLH